LLASLSRRIGGLEGGRILRAVARMLAAAVVMAVVAALVGRAAGAPFGPGLLRDLVTVVAGVGAGLCSYLLAARLLRVEEIGVLLGVVRRRAR